MGSAQQGRRRRRQVLKMREGLARQSVGYQGNTRRICRQATRSGCTPTCSDNSPAHSSCRSSVSSSKFPRSVQRFDGASACACKPAPGSTSGCRRSPPLPRAAASSATMPPKQRRARSLGLLGMELPGSSDDEDYCPPGVSGGSKGQPAPKRQRRRQRQEVADEDVPLAQRRRNLMATSRSPQSAAARPAAGSSGAGGLTAAAAAAAGGDSTAAPAGPAVHLPEEVLCLILRAACAPAAGGAIPTAAAGAVAAAGWLQGGQVDCAAALKSGVCAHFASHPHASSQQHSLAPCAAACVSRGWHAAVQACPDLWSHIDLARGRRCRPSDAALARAAPRWHRLRSLSLAGVAGVGDAGLQVREAGWGSAVA